jgi:hypothetical protein
MAPPDSIAGAAKTQLYLSVSEGAQAAPENRAEMLVRRLDNRLQSRLDQIRDQLEQPPKSPNSDQTGTRLDILA